jgi:rubrerythrin
MELKGSKTEQNLKAAFAGESQARNKYTYYASVAKKAGYEQIRKIFEETANNEKEHAKIWFKLFMGGMPDIKALWQMQQPVNIMNGPTCMLALPRPLKKKASTRLLLSLPK